MDREDIIAVAVRLFAIYLLFGIIGRVPAAIQSFAESPPFAAIAILILFAGLAICVMLWEFPLAIARRLLPVMREPRSEQTIGARQALSLGITLIGLWFLVEAIIEASYWLTTVLLIRRYDMGRVQMPLAQWASLVSTAVKFVVALGLLFGANGIRNLIERLRHGNRVYADNEPPTG